MRPIRCGRCWQWWLIGEAEIDCRTPYLRMTSRNRDENDHSEGPGGRPTEPGKKLWAAILGEYQLEDHELALLTEIVRTMALLDSLDGVLRAEGPIVESPQGQRAHPAAVEARQQRLGPGPPARRPPAAVRRRGRRHPAAATADRSPHPVQARGRWMRRHDVAARPLHISPPAALCDHLSPVWRSARLTDRWWWKHLGGPAPVEGPACEWGTPNWATRFGDTVTAWADLAGLKDPNTGVDWEQLAALGVQRANSLDRAAARAGADGYCCHVRQPLNI
jgi:hypothetical protein